MACRKYLPLAAILTSICLDISSVVAAAAAVARDPQTSRYDGYNLDKGPVFYEAYYPDAYQENKRYSDRVLETSFQVPAERFAYSSAESADRSASNNESSSREDRANLPPEQRRETSAFRDDYSEAASRQLPPIHDQRSTILGENGEPRATSIEEISKLVRRAISRDLEDWSALERYFAEHLMLPPRPGMFSEGRRENTANDGYSLFLDSSRPSRNFDEILRRSEARDATQRPVYLERVEDENAPTRAGASVSVTSSSPPENIFQPRPQVIRYKFFKRPERRLDEQTDVRAIDDSTPRNYGDNLLREETIAGNSRGDSTEESGDVKVTSIQVSELPHKTRHHHGEWPKRDYSAHRHRSPAGHPVV